MNFIEKWIEDCKSAACPENVLVYKEGDGARDEIFQELIDSVLDNLVGLDLIEQMGGFPESIQVIRNRIPSELKTQSGDLGEIVATEYVSGMTDYLVPVRKLRYKDDRNLPMRGDDLVAIRQEGGATSLYKIEAKSRNSLSNSVVDEACQALEKHEGRPNPSSLAFISLRLRQDGNDELAEIVEEMQVNPIPDKRITHMVFTLSGNQAENYLSAHAAGGAKFSRLLVGIEVEEHTNLVQTVYEAIVG